MINSQIALLDKPAEILLVEGDQSDCFLIKRAFGSSLENFVITVAENGKTGLELLQSDDGRHEFDLVIIDINMLVMDDYQFLKDLRGDNKISKIPVVVMINSESQSQLDKAYELGANIVIQKDKFFDLAPQVVQILVDYWYRLANVPDS